MLKTTQTFFIDVVTQIIPTSLSMFHVKYIWTSSVRNFTKQKRKPKVFSSCFSLFVISNRRVLIFLTMHTLLQIQSAGVLLVLLYGIISYFSKTTITRMVFFYLFYNQVFLVHFLTILFYKS